MISDTDEELIAEAKKHGADYDMPYITVGIFQDTILISTKELRAIINHYIEQDRAQQHALASVSQASLATPQPQSVRYFTDTLTLDLLSADEEGNLTANGGQESEAQAVGVIGQMGNAVIRVDLPFGTNLYIAPPSAIAIETAALRKAAEELREQIGWSDAADEHDEFVNRMLENTAVMIESIIPQDGITELEKFGMKVAMEVAHKYAESQPESLDLRAIVKSVIGESL